MPDAVLVGPEEVDEAVLLDPLPDPFGDDGTLPLSDQTLSREPPPQNSVLSPVHIVEQLPCATLAVEILLPQ